MNLKNNTLAKNISALNADMFSDMAKVVSSALTADIQGALSLITREMIGRITLPIDLWRQNEKNSYFFIIIEFLFC